MHAKVASFTYKCKSWLKPSDTSKTVEDMKLDDILDAAPPS